MPSPSKAAHLRSVFGQLKSSINVWEQQSVSLSIIELDELADVWAGFVEAELRKALPPELRGQVQSITISPGFAESAVTVDLPE